MTYDHDKVKKHLARRAANGLRKTSKSRAKSSGRSALTRAKLSITDDIQKVIAETRASLFGKDEVPFEDIEAMGKWIVEEGKKQPPPEGHAPQYGYKTPKGISGEELRKLHEEKPGYYGSEHALLKYPGGDGWQRVILLPDDKRLRKLWLSARYIAKELDCQEAQATGLILTGRLPIVPPLSVTATPTINTKRPSRGKIEITIRAPIPEGDLIKVYRRLRKLLWGNIRSKPANDRDCALVEFVSERRDKAGWESWESVRQEWNKTYPEWAYRESSGWHGFRKKFRDAWKKVYPDVSWEDITFTN